MREVLLKTKYPDGTPLEVVHEDDMYKWQVDGLSHIEQTELTLSKDQRCGWASQILRNLIKI